MKRICFMLLCLGFISAPLWSQEEEMKESSSALENAFTARPADMWELGIGLQLPYYAGDVSSAYPGGIGGALHLRKAINYTFSVRAELMYQSVKGTDQFVIPGATTTANSQLRSVGYNENTPYVRNYSSDYYGISGQLLINSGNILFHNATPKWNVYGVLGVGLYTYSTSYNALNNNDLLYSFRNLVGEDDIRQAAKDLLDDTYETAATRRSGIFSLSDEQDVYISGQLGAGISRKVSDRVNISLEHTMHFAFHDYLDGYTFRTNLDRSNNSDVLHVTALKVNINLGSSDKKVQPLYWVNPLNTAYNDIAALKKRPEVDLTDSDGDGVLDMFDEDTETPSGAAVDVKGNALDTDKDGIPDYKDKELLSPNGYPVDQNGIAQIDDPYLTKAEIQQLIDGKLDKMRMNWWLPMIHFELDKKEILPEMIPNLKQIASVMHGNPNVSILVKGYADNRAKEAYNNRLSYERAEAAINYMVQRYGVDRNRFIIQYGGEANPLVEGLPDRSGLPKKQEDQHYLNRRVEFSIAGPNDTSMPRPDGTNSQPQYRGNRNTGY